MLRGIATIVGLAGAVVTIIVGLHQLGIGGSGNQQPTDTSSLTPVRSTRSAIVTSPTPITTPATQSPIVDRCLVGTWRATVTYAYDSSGRQGSLSGGAGTLLTIDADGTETYDYSLSQPVQGVVEGHHIVYVLRGYGTVHVMARGGRIVESDADHSHVGAAVSIDGAAPFSAPPEWTSASTYACSSAVLRLDKDEYKRT